MTASDRIYALLSTVLPKYNGLVLGGEDYDTAHGLALTAYADITRMCEDFLKGSDEIVLTEHYSIRPDYSILSLEPPCFVIGFDLYLDGNRVGAIEDCTLDADHISLLVQGGAFCIGLGAGIDTAEGLKELAEYAISEVEDMDFVRSHYANIKRRGRSP